MARSLLRHVSVLAARAAVATTAFVAPASATAAADTDVGVTMSAPSSTQIDEDIALVTTVHNNGPDPASSLQLTLSVTGGDTTFVSLVTPARWTCDPRTVGGGVGAIACSSLGPLATDVLKGMTLRG